MNNKPYTYAVGKLMTHQATEPNRFGVSQPARYEDVLFRQLDGVVEVRITRIGATPEWFAQKFPSVSHRPEYSFKRYMKHLKKLARNLTEVSIGQTLSSHDEYGHDDMSARLIVTGWSKKISDNRAVVLKGLVFA